MTTFRFRASHLSLVFGLASLIGAAAVGACSPADGPSTVPQQTDASADTSLTPSPDASSPPDSGTDANTVCNALTTEGLSKTTISSVADGAPQPLGGTLEDGDYVYEGSTVYASATLPQIDGGLQKMKLAGGVAQIAFNNAPDRSLPDHTVTETWTQSGTNITSTRSCPAAAVAQIHAYTVEKNGADTRLLLFGEDQGKTVVARLKKL